MFDITQYGVTVSISKCTSTIISQYFMQDVLIMFGLCHLAAIDDGTPFKSIFPAMCDCLTINHEVVTKRNHKGVSVERFHRFLNNVVTIT